MKSLLESIFDTDKNIKKDTTISQLFYIKNADFLHGTGVAPFNGCFDSNKLLKFDKPDLEAAKNYGSPDIIGAIFGLVTCNNFNVSTDVVADEIKNSIAKYLDSKHQASKLSVNVTYMYTQENKKIPKRISVGLEYKTKYNCQLIMWLERK